MSWNFDEPVARENTCCVKYDLRKEVFGTSEVLPMWVADMDFKTPGFIIDALKKRLNHEILGYSFRPGSYYGSIISWLKNRHNWQIEKEWICYSPGVVPSLNLCTLAFTRPGDSIIVQPPVYFPFFSAVENHGRNLVYNKLLEKDGKWTMDFGGLESLIDSGTKMIIISNPHNPVGRAWSEEELLRLASICLDRNILILSDEIHSDLILPGYSHHPIARLSDSIAEITVTCISPSKTFNLAGLSTSSVIISNPVLRKYFNSKIEHLSLGNGNIFGNTASEAAYSHGSEWVDELMHYINENVEYVTDYLGQMVPEITPVRPEATYMIWLDCRKMGLKGKDLKDFFVQRTNVGMNEGSSFGPGGESFMRMNLATTRDNVRKAMEQIEKGISLIR